jgi:hypothetical protein
MVEVATTYRADTASAGVVPYIHWSAVIAGAIGAAAISFVMVSFGAAIGLSLVSPSATWRDTSAALALLSGVWLLITSLVSFAVGGYIAGRLRAGWTNANADEVDFRDGLHGLLVWGLAIIFGAFLAVATARSLAPAAGNALAPSGSSAEPLLAYEIDKLFRADRRPGDVVDTETRGQAARVIASSLGHSDMAAEDRSYLVRLVAARTGLSPADAERRVSDVVAQSKLAVRRARRSAVLLAFFTAASLLVGAAVAWFAAGYGGRHRELGITPEHWFRNGVRTATLP